MLPGLETERLVLRPAAESDLHTLWAQWADADVRRYLFDDVEVTRERAAAVLADCLALAEDGLGLWMIHLRGEPAPVGCAGLLPVSVAAEYEPRLADGVEPLAALAPAAWSHGYATEALAALLAYAFGARGLPRVAAVADVPNNASHRLLERLGFAVLGEVDGPRYRMRTYELTREAYEASAPG